MQIKNWTINSILIVSITIGLTGCGQSNQNSGKKSSLDDMANEADAQNAARKQQADAAAAKAAADKKAADDAAAKAPPAEQERKAVGSRPTIEGGGYLRAIAGAHRHVMNVVDNLAWIQGVRNFKGTYGRKPKDTKEFMNVCVKENDLSLPKIEDDEEYLYDPNGETDGDFGQLYVVKKATAPPNAPAPSNPAAPK